MENKVYLFRDLLKSFFPDGSVAHTVGKHINPTTLMGSEELCGEDSQKSSRHAFLARRKRPLQCNVLQANAVEPKL